MQNVLRRIGALPLRLLRRPWYTWLCTRPLLESFCFRAVVSGCGWVRGTLAHAARAARACGAGPLLRAFGLSTGGPSAPVSVFAESRR